ncbi:hypothetical protein LTR37_015028 [Vermiconidia calcicola]|uniref:Uncharacterized protein n=1 Tax=Vermiconidia calcicola TaxID=1690605 RepID=A0ACC3MTE7_9PEZI|nr:hypothetical protein LTR37_015028 [Vermiconidia calcicola]
MNLRSISRRPTYNEMMSEDTPAQRFSGGPNAAQMAPAAAYNNGHPGYSSPSPAPLQQQYQTYVQQNIALGQQTAQCSVQYLATSSDPRMSISNVSGQTFATSNPMSGINMPGMQQQAFQSAPNMLQQDPFHAPSSQQVHTGAISHAATPQPQSQGYNLPGQQQQQIGSPPPPGYQRQQLSHFEQAAHPSQYQQTHAGMSSPSPAPTHAQPQKVQNVAA